MSEIIDESDENIRIVIEPKNRDVSPELLMENLFKLTDLEAQVHLNLNYLDKNLCVMNVLDQPVFVECFMFFFYGCLVDCYPDI